MIAITPILVNTPGSAMTSDGPGVNDQRLHRPSLTARTHNSSSTHRVSLAKRVFPTAR